MYASIKWVITDSGNADFYKFGHRWFGKMPDPWIALNNSLDYYTVFRLETHSRVKKVLVVDIRHMQFT